MDIEIQQSKIHGALNEFRRPIFQNQSIFPSVLSQKQRMRSSSFFGPQPTLNQRCSASDRMM